MKLKKANLPTISVVIPCYNEETTIGHCLAALAVQEPQALEVIIVDNNCSDRTVEIAKRFSFVKIISEKKQGISFARNAGMNAATGDVLARIDADSVVHADWIKALQTIFSDETIAAATGPVQYHDMPAKRTGQFFDQEIRAALDAVARDYRFLFGSNMAVRRDVWHSIVSELCNDDSLHEDIDIALHIHEKGGLIKYDRSMVAGMSARRLEDKPKDFYKYVMKYERTYDAHNVKSLSARTPIFIYLATYFPMKMLRAVYDGEKHRFSLKKLRKVAEEKLL
jgi:glycosyltransferase involved in cell wall biosynthesis